MVWTNQGLERDMSYETTQDVKLLLIFFLVTWGISQEKIIFLQNTFYTNLGPKKPPGYPQQVSKFSFTFHKNDLGVLKIV